MARRTAIVLCSIVDQSQCAGHLCIPLLRSVSSVADVLLRHRRQLSASIPPCTSRMTLAPQQLVQQRSNRQPTLLVTVIGDQHALHDSLVPADDVQSKSGTT